MAAQSFTKNHRDHSNDTGFQFEFFCDKCGNGVTGLAFKTNGLGVAASLLKAAGSVFGGCNEPGQGVGRRSRQGRLSRAGREQRARSAMEECRPKFRQCSLCGNWVCPEVCWNHKPVNLCEAWCTGSRRARRARTGRNRRRTSTRAGTQRGPAARGRRAEPGGRSGFAMRQVSGVARRRREVLRELRRTGWRRCGRRPSLLRELRHCARRWRSVLLRLRHRRSRLKLQVSESQQGARDPPMVLHFVTGARLVSRQSMISSMWSPKT